MGSIFEAKRHPEKFKKAKRGDDCRFGDVLGVHWDLMVPPDQVYFAEDGLSGQGRGKVVYPRDGVSIVRGDNVELAVVPAWAMAPPRAWVPRGSVMNKGSWTSG